MFHLRSTVTCSVEADLGNIFEIKKNLKALCNQPVQLQIPDPELVKRFCRLGPNSLRSFTGNRYFL